MSRGGRSDPHDAPQRRCIVTRQSGDTARLIRFVPGPDGQVVPDIGGKLPGRGMWVTADAAILQQAVARGAFARAARQPVTAPADLVAMTEAALARRVVELISLARKAGQAVAGFEKVRAALESGWASVLVQARDGSAGQTAKLRPPAGEHNRIACLTSRELGLAFGRENVIHGALAGGGLCRRVVEEAARLEGFRGIDRNPGQHQV